ncbi:tetratricopeptide repeat domain protein [Synechococcus sp. PCC 7335]|uniref:glycosyltransferase n=1 Tax=Synechococcus sp. (strain ATCC 29403 / PCC 7335) TaxID=91464 RepID=UPI00017EDD1E|nr:glycosyltransferase family 2 protein [Synechococcus sp. PCC 7335]EDX87459.1 tetratricopeptide repeat domain protein [Synechococcus sp. PCC 7335]
MATLSLCMIVKDEAKNLPRALSSVKHLADEIIVLDTGSGDDTPMIAAAAGAKVNFLMWGDDFAIARNASLDQATQDWILVLDADETLTAAGQRLIATIRAEKPLGQIDPANLLMVTALRREIAVNQSPYTQVSRLFRNLVSIKYTRPIYESVDDSIEALMAAEPHWQVAQLDGATSGAIIEHTNYSVTPIEAKDKFKRAERIMTKYLAANPEDKLIANKLGALYVQSRAWEKALTLLHQALKASAITSRLQPLTEYEAYYHLGIVHRYTEDFEAAEAAYRKAIAVPIAELLKLSAYLNLGALLKLKGNLDGAIAQYEAAGRIDPKHPVTFFNLGVVHKAKGYLEPAMRAYEYAIALDPNYGVAYQNLGAVLFKLGKLPQSKAAFDKAISLAEKLDPTEAERLRQGVKRLGLDEALKSSSRSSSK